MEVRKTSRGFEKIEFKDRYGARCSLQQSSLADYTVPGTSAIWFGVDDPDPQVLVKGKGWQKYPLPKEVQCATRMHLDLELLRELLPYLNRWAENGSFQEKEEDKAETQE